MSRASRLAVLVLLTLVTAVGIRVTVGPAVGSVSTVACGQAPVPPTPWGR